VVTIRYDTRCYFNVRSKADISQLNLPHGTDNWLGLGYTEMVMVSEATITTRPTGDLWRHAVDRDMVVQRRDGPRRLRDDHDDDDDVMVIGVRLIVMGWLGLGLRVRVEG